MSGVMRCRWCGARVFWLHNVTTNRLAPIDVDPVADGNVVIDAELGVYNVLFGQDARDANPVVADPSAEPTLHKNHFATCRNVAVQKRSRDRAHRAGAVAR